MIALRIGTIGSTQGVSDSSAPSPANSSAIDSRSPRASVEAIRSSSAACPTATATDRGPGSTRSPADAPVPPPAAADASAGPPAATVRAAPSAGAIVRGSDSATRVVVGG